MCSDQWSIPNASDRPGAHDCFLTNIDMAEENSQVSFSTYGENVLYSSQATSGEAAIQQWLDSPGHYLNAMNDNFNQAGIGYYQCLGTNTWHWVTLYGRL